MKGRPISILLWVGILVLSSTVLFAQERWVYRYNGPGYGRDSGNSIITGLNGNIYAAGEIRVSDTDRDLAVVSLNPSGAERWIYRHEGAVDTMDGGNSTAVGPDGNLYVGGRCRGSGTGGDFTVLSLDTLGLERWVYQYDGSGNSWDEAHSVFAGFDGNLYAAGRSYEDGTSGDLTVVSLSSSGSERWVYRYGGPGLVGDWANSVIMGPDGNLYVAGSSHHGLVSSDFTVVSLNDSGGERWVYRYDPPGNGWDEAYAIAVDTDGNLYAAGRTYGSGTASDLTVVSLSGSGAERWVYRHDGGASGWDGAYSITMGSDGDLYVPGYSYTSVGYDFTVVSLSSSGSERWVYRYVANESGMNRATAVVEGPDGNLYAAGMVRWSMTREDFTVVSLTDSGVERWVYHYNGNSGPGNHYDWASSIAVGLDGSIYSAGSSEDSASGQGLTIVSLSPDVGVEERLSEPSVVDFRLLQNHPNPLCHSTTISYSLAIATEPTLAIYDIAGRLVEALVNETQQPGIHQVSWNRKANPSGVYFYCLKAGNFVETRNMVVVE